MFENQNFFSSFSARGKRQHNRASIPGPTISSERNTFAICFFPFPFFSVQFNRRVWTEFHVSWPYTWPRICYVPFDYFLALYNALVSESMFVVAMKLWRIPIVLSYF